MARSFNPSTIALYRATSRFELTRYLRDATCFLGIGPNHNLTAVATLNGGCI